MEHMSITASASGDRNILLSLSKACKQSACNTISSHLSRCGEQDMCTMTVAGNWNNMAKLERLLDDISNDPDTFLQYVRCPEENHLTNFLPYIVHMTTIESPSILAEIINFFVSADITILEANTTQYTTSKTGVKMSNINLTILLPANENLADFREAFLVFSDGQNIDSFLEPHR